jgi:hypothetical protein
MNKTISVLMCRRLDYGRQVMEHISRAKGLEDWRVFVYCDKSLKSVGANQAQIGAMVAEFPFVTKFISSPSHRGLREATRWALNDIFSNKMSDINLHVEDDVLISPCALKFVENCHPYIAGNIGSVSLVGDIQSERVADRKTVFKTNWFNCGWGWATTKEFYFNHFLSAPYVGDRSSWARDIDMLYKNSGFLELRTNSRRAKNIGVEFSTHPKIKARTATLNCFDVGDDWCGARDGPLFEFDFSKIQ